MHARITVYVSFMKQSPSQLTDDALLIEVKRLAQCERETIATLVAHLVEIERRDLYRAEGCSSMFTYCTEVLRFSEDATVLRLQAARLARQHPVILEDLASGALHLSALRSLVPHLTSETAPELLVASRHKTKREVEKFVRERFPLPDLASTIRKLPVQSAHATAAKSSWAETGAATVVEEATEAAVAAAPGTGEAASVGVETGGRPGEPAPRAHIIAPLAAERYKVQFAASAELHDKLRRAQDLLRHQVPNGDLSRVFEVALNALIERLEKQKLAATDRPRVSRGTVPDSGANRSAAQGSRTIPAAVKRAVWRRDGGRCGFIGTNNRRCSETGFLEFHHVVAFARGGEATVANIALRCRSHNQYEAKLGFGPFDPACVREASAPWGMQEMSALWGVRARGEHRWTCAR